MIVQLEQVKQMETNMPYGKFLSLMVDGIGQVFFQSTKQEFKK